MIEKIKNLNLFQKIILILLAAMAVIFCIVYAVTTSRIGFAYKGAILVPETAGSDTVYSGKIHGEEAVFTVTADKTLTFRYGEKTYGPYAVKEDPTVVPKEHDMAAHMTGIEILCNDSVWFRGGYLKSSGSGSNLMLFDEEGEWEGFSIQYTVGDGVVRGTDGNVIDTMAPSAETILKLIDGPELTHKGEMMAWFAGVFLSLLTAALILFADEIFRFNLSFQIRDAYRAEPSEWEMAGRYISWTVLPIMILILYIMGLS